MTKFACASCGQPSNRPRKGQKSYCSRKCQHQATHHTARAKASAEHDLRFVGVDGEGVDRPDGTHEYVMLSVGDKTLFNNGEALTLQQIFGFLWDCYLADPRACYVGFYLGYDFIQWQKLLPEAVARSLLSKVGIAARKSEVTARLNPTPDPVVYEGWEFDVLNGRRLKLRPHVCVESKFNTACRNRTCKKELWNDEPGFDVIGRSTSIGVLADAPTDTFWDMVPTVPTRTSSTKAPEWLYVCDTGTFWQAAFLNVINPAAWAGDPVCTKEEYATVQQGKLTRGIVADHGDTSYFEEMRQYNVLENELLARVTRRLNLGFAQSDIPIKITRNNWYGPGRAAQAWLDQLHSKVADPHAVKANRSQLTPQRENEKGIVNADIYMSVPSWFIEASQASYYGGWFEQFMHGHVGDVWEYDINSAYPFIIGTLPCLHTERPHTGHYQRGHDGSSVPMGDGRLTLVYGTFRGSDSYIGCLPYRARDGGILRPNNVKGWYWKHEIDAAVHAGIIDSMEIEEWASYIPCHCSSPFNPPDIGIEALYQLRLKVGKNAPQGKAAKLVYNSAYGKTAQSVGEPKFSNPIYASLITAGCRTLILQAIASHPLGTSAVSMVATDGVYFTSPHMGLSLDVGRLGAWDESAKTGMTQLMPGMYYDDDTRRGILAGKSPKLKSRGISANDIVEEVGNFDNWFEDMKDMLGDPTGQLALFGPGGDFTWPTGKVKVKFMLTSAVSALHRNKWASAGEVLKDTERKIDTDPKTKRNPHAYLDNGIIRTKPYPQGSTGLETTPYNKSFGYNEDKPGLFKNEVPLNGPQPDRVFYDMLDL